ncbi:MAG: hypothetical protein KJ734_14955, partial [Chloroflexi bacterium]|nr:hypothetical protein [Chloroflexota bacterium]
EHDEVLARLDRIPPGQKSTYIRRVLAGAPVEVLDQAIKETKFVAGLLDGMWDDEWDDRVGDLEDRLSKK